jgi:hypothetical protein
MRFVAQSSLQLTDSKVSSIAQFILEAPTWLTPTVGAVLAGVAHHQYAFVDGATQASMAAEARTLSGGKSSWSTEICCRSTRQSYRLIAQVRMTGFTPSDSSSANEPLSTVGYGAQYDPTIVGGLRMANLIYQSIGDAQEEHWSA